jgi:hypothetical protein
MLRGIAPRPEIRVRTGDGEVEVVQRESTPDIEESGFNERFPSLSRSPERAPRHEDARPVRPREKPSRNVVRVYPYGIARTRLERAIRESNAPAYITNDIAQADAVIAIRTTFQNKPKKLRELNRPIPTVVVKSNTFSQIASALDQVVTGFVGSVEVDAAAIQEVAKAIETVRQTGKAVELSPQGARVRKLQHRELERNKMTGEAIGEEPDRRIRVMPVIG